MVIFIYSIDHLGQRIFGEKQLNPRSLLPCLCLQNTQIGALSLRVLYSWSWENLSVRFPRNFNYLFTSMWRKNAPFWREENVPPRDFGENIFVPTSTQRSCTPSWSRLDSDNTGDVLNNSFHIYIQYRRPSSERGWGWGGGAASAVEEEKQDCE